MTSSSLLRPAAALLLVVLVGACGAPVSEQAAPTAATATTTAPGTTTADAATPPSPSADTEAQHIELQFADGTVAGGVQRVPVALGSTVELSVTSDVADELHLHGYDESAAVPAGGTGTVTFVADIPGIFELELEELGEELAKLEVR